MPTTVRIPPCKSCHGSQERGRHGTWEDCSEEMRREDLRFGGRFARPRGHRFAVTSEKWESR